MQGIRYRGQMALVSDLKGLELAVPHKGGAVLKGWRTPKIGTAFEGKPFAVVKEDGSIEQLFTRRWIVPDEAANALENMYGVRPNLGKVHVGAKELDIIKAVDVATFLPKRAKLVGSFFQQMDFLNRSGVGAGSAAVDALFRGRPLEAVQKIAVWPRSAAQILQANFSPKARLNLLKKLNSTEPLVVGRPGVHLKGIGEGGLSTIDVTLLPGDLDGIARSVAEEHGLARVKAVGRAISGFEGATRRGLFEGVYPAAQITDIENNIAAMFVRQFPKETDEAINGMIARFVNIKYSTIPASQSVFQNRTIRETLRRVFFSMGESEGLMRQASGAFRGPYKALWAKHWLGAYVWLIGTANAIHFASTGKPLPLERYLPISKNNFSFLPFGYNTSFASPNLPLGGRHATQVTLDLVGQLDTAFRILDPRSFVASRESVPVRAASNQLTGEDFFGAPIDDVGPNGIVSRTAQLMMDMFAPIGVGQSGIGILRENVSAAEKIVPPGEERLGTKGLAVQALGVNLRAETTPDLLDRFARENFDGRSYGELEPNERRQLDQVQELKEELDKRQKEALERERESAQFRERRTEQDQMRLSQETALAQEYTLQEITGDEFRRRYSDIQGEHAAAQSAINRVFQRFQETGELPDDPNDRALAQYYNAFDRATRGSGILDFETLETDMQRLEIEWIPEQKAYVDRNTGLAEHPPLIQQYRNDRETLEQYWEVGRNYIEPERFEGIWQAYLDGNDTKKDQLREQHGGFISFMVSRQRADRVRLRFEEPSIEVALVRWGYVKPRTREGFEEQSRLAQGGVPTPVSPGINDTQATLKNRIKLPVGNE